MQRVTITIDDDLAAELERGAWLCQSLGSDARSSAIRLAAKLNEQAGGLQQCVAALIYVYDHHQRELPKRLTRGK
jgi:CopG family transcriptional regulator, nickel-responsive regulator